MALVLSLVALMSSDNARELKSFLSLCDILASEPDEARRARVAAALAAPGGIASIVDMAKDEGVLPALGEAVESRYADLVSREWRAALAVQHEENRRRNQAFHRAIIEIGAAADKRGIELVALKGAAWALEDPNGCAAWRSMVDIDLLVEPEFFGDMAEVLTSLGYVPYGVRRQFFGRRRRWDNHFHLIPHIRNDVPGPIEVHRHVGMRPSLLSTSLVFGGRRLVAPGLALASPWCGACHAILHWQEQHHAYRRGSSELKEVFELGSFLARPDVDWSALRAHVETVGVMRECNAALALASELLGAAIPPAMRPAPEGDRHVRYCLAIRACPRRARLALLRSRTWRLWQADRIVYRLSVHGASMWRVRTMVYLHRLFWTPVFVARAVAITAGAFGLWLRDRGTQRSAAIESPEGIT